MDRGRDSQEKIDALDLIINVLKEHEKRLDKLAEELKETLDNLSLSKKVSEPIKREEIHPQIRIVCSDWSDFKEKSKNSNLVVFDVDEKYIRFNSISNSSIYQYSEPIVDVKLRLDKDGENYRIKRGDIKSLLERLAQKKFKCGVEPSISVKLMSLGEDADVLVFKFYPEKSKLKNWLAKELEVSPENVIYGKIGFSSST